MRPNNWPTIDPDNLGDTIDKWKDTLARPLQRIVSDVALMLDNGLLLKDNQFTALVTLSCVHGQETLIANPLRNRSRPIGFTPILCENDSGAAFTISSCSLNRSRGDGLFGITVNYAPPVETQRITRARSASTAMVSATPKNICATPSVVLTAGDWLVSGAIGFNTTGGAVTTFLDASISLGTGALSGADTICLPTSGEARNYNNENHTGSDYSVFIPPYRTSVAASATKTLFLVGNIVTAAAAASAYGNLEAVRLTTDPATTARVTGILWGG